MKDSARIDPSVTTLLILRHAETAAPERFHGAESDVGLGERGRRQAEAVADWLATRRLDSLVSSGMRRALETAAPIASACRLDVEVVSELHERKMGALSGRPKHEGWALYESEKRRWMAGDLDATHEGAESYAQVRARVVPAVRDLAHRHSGETVAIVTHGVVIRVLLTSLLEGYSPAGFDAIAIRFVAVNEVVFDGRGWRAVALDQAMTD